MTRWLELTTHVDPEAVEAVAEVFREHGQGGVAIEEAVEAFADREGYVVRPDRPVVVRTYLPLDAEAGPRRQAIAEALWHLGRLRPVGPLETRALDEEDWANAWKEHYHVLRVGARLVIRPTWRDYTPGPGELVIDLDPGMAFGTGLHPTTHLCLLELERLVRPGQVVLDLGTGSGILAIAAARLGAARVLALDVDPVAVAAARHNIAANGLDGIISVEAGSIDGPEQLSIALRREPNPPTPFPTREGGVLHGDGSPFPRGVLIVNDSPFPGREGGRGVRLPSGVMGQFDLVVANIIARVLGDLARPLVEAVRPGGLVVASGIIDERLDEVRAALEAAGLAAVEVRAEGDWRVIVGQRPRAAQATA